MRAIRCHRNGPPEALVVEEIPAPEAQEGQIVIAVHAAALNFPDGLQIQGKYQYQPPHPFTPGSEVAGIVQACGPGVHGLAVGDRVMAVCGIGGLAEEVAVATADARRIPPGMDFHAAAGFAMTYTTSYHALKQRARLAAGETLLVLGASGGVGLAAVELGKAMGARVIAAASSDEKLAFASRYHPDAVVNYGDGELKEKVKALTDGRGADVIYDPVGGELFEQCCRCIAWNGRLLVVGFASGRIPDCRANLVLLKGSSVVGVFLGRFRKEEPAEYERNFSELLHMCEAGKLRPPAPRRFAFEDYEAAFGMFSARKAMGKVTLAVRA